MTGDVRLKARLGVIVVASTGAMLIATGIAKFVRPEPVREFLNQLLQTRANDTTIVLIAAAEASIGALLIAASGRGFGKRCAAAVLSALLTVHLIGGSLPKVTRSCGCAGGFVSRALGVAERQEGAILAATVFVLLALLFVSAHTALSARTVQENSDDE
jgi:hypothetical protein